jgi:hypothetical protein
MRRCSDVRVHERLRPGSACRRAGSPTATSTRASSCAATTRWPSSAARSDRTLAVRATGYTTPWHGTCEESARVCRERVLADVAVELGVDRARAATLGLADSLFEYKLSCADLEKRAVANALRRGSPAR